MKRLSQPRSRENIKSEFARKGITIRDWAVANGFSPTLVYDILRSPDRRCDRGESHRIAVKLGIKAGEITDPSSVKDAFN